MQIEPIGVFRGTARWKFDAPRQGVFSGRSGIVELQPHRNFEVALRDLDGFERIWLLFLFDRNGKTWRPTTRPPVPAPGHERVGLFASRSPYRPNPIGLSCVKLLSVKGLELEVDDCDLLDGTPVIDIKPYIPSADAFPNAKAGWAELCDKDLWIVETDGDFEVKSAFIFKESGYDILSTAQLQLSHSPLDSTRKRLEIRESQDNGNVNAVLSIRMFRIDFEARPGEHKVIIHDIRSGYTPEELSNPADPYADKDVHRKFTAFPR